MITGERVDATHSGDHASQQGRTGKSSLIISAKPVGVGPVSAVDSDGRTIFVVDAHRDDGQRFIVRAYEKLSAFLELESAIRAATAVGYIAWCERAAKLRIIHSGP